jgi:hypothetical protein
MRGLHRKSVDFLIQVLRFLRIPLGAPAKADSFWRVCWANEENTVLRASSNQLELLDLRVSIMIWQNCHRLTPYQGGPASLGMELTPKERITALEARTSDGIIDPHLITITTDKRVVWLDDRYLAAPLISWEHNRARDATLKATSYSLGSSMWFIFIANIIQLILQLEGRLLAYLRKPMAC